MKEALNLIFGKELAWFRGLPLQMKCRIVWFAVSFSLICAISLEESNVWSIIVVVANFCCSIIGLRGVSTDGLEE